VTAAALLWPCCIANQVCDTETLSGHWN